MPDYRGETSQVARQPLVQRRNGFRFPMPGQDQVALSVCLLSICGISSARLAHSVERPRCASTQILLTISGGVLATCRDGDVSQQLPLQRPDTLDAPA